MSARKDQPADRGILLLVEDEPIVALVAREILEEAGFRVVAAALGARALAEAEALHARGEALALAIVDVGLPDMDGDVLVRALKAMRPDLPVLVATGYRADEIDLPMGQAERITLLAKPYDGAALRGALRGMGFDIADD